MAQQQERFSISFNIFWGFYSVRTAPLSITHCLPFFHVLYFFYRKG
ncbi:hypothetical protein HMPREF0663_10791 [Hoylesella oralis ATCC 33269]|uniref:Uncharacterized protein n=1 Tax=Hoylesella oralis ATCC 33269 TaxID=873533 RepID=E7RNP0_9BACT|nr:hypothetical protein HMPREF0663_10791 [Hoylesella oralis ATCC 33269]